MKLGRPEILLSTSAVSRHLKSSMLSAQTLFPARLKAMTILCRLSAVSRQPKSLMLSVLTLFPARLKAMTIL